MRKEAEIERSIEDFDAAPDVEALARNQGVGPLDFARARRLSKFWPQKESNRRLHSDGAAMAR